MSHSVSTKSVPVQWSSKPEFAPFGDRLNFLSPERAQLATGKMRLLPPLNPEKRQKK